MNWYALFKLDPLGSFRCRVNLQTGCNEILHSGIPPHRSSTLSYQTTSNLSYRKYKVDHCKVFGNKLG
jgi:hypothetical protein